MGRCEGEQFCLTRDIDPGVGETNIHCFLFAPKLSGRHFNKNDLGVQYLKYIAVRTSSTD